MAAITALLFLFIFWTGVNLFRVALLFLSPGILTRWQQQHGISIGTLSVTWHSTYFNHWFNSFSPKRTLNQWQYRFYTRYFTAGVWLTLAMFPYAMFIIMSKCKFACQFKFSKQNSNYDIYMNLKQELCFNQVIFLKIFDIFLACLTSRRIEQQPTQ